MAENEFEFDTEFMQDYEIEEMLDSLLLDLGNQVTESESRASMINPNRLKQIALSYNALKYLTQKTDTKVSYMLHEPFQSVGCISVEGKDISFSNTKLFVKICQLASNVDVYPLTNGCTKMDLTFHKLTEPIE